MIYLDTAAVVKLVHAEPESMALRTWPDARAETGWVSSVVTEIESFRALARYAPGTVSRLPLVLDEIELIDLDAHPDPGTDGLAGNRSQPGRDPPWHGTANRPGADVVRHL